MTKQEKKFADEYVLLFFAASAVSVETATAAADYAGYALPADIRDAETAAKALLAKKDIAKYISTEIAAFRVRLSGEQRRNLWKAIRAFKPGTPENEDYFGDICVH